MTVTTPDPRRGTASVFTTKSRLSAFFQKYPVLILLAIFWIVLMLAVAGLGHLFAPRDYMAMNLTARLSEPVGLGGTWAYPLGTDELGRDVLSRLIASIRISLTIAFLATLVSATIGVALGFLAAFLRGRAEQAILMVIDARRHALHDHRPGGAGLSGQFADAVHHPAGVLRMGADRTHRAWPCHRRPGSGLCRRRVTLGLALRGSTACISCPTSPRPCWCR
ncbi:hypothetical protein [Rhodophyticola sp.]|uniref:hypothetical protein n=1 Tax=Rhodophyticola sp. TaxID=2680032 RepID=UPI003D2E5CEF